MQKIGRKTWLKLASEFKKSSSLLLVRGTSLSSIRTFVERSNRSETKQQRAAQV